MKMIFHLGMALAVLIAAGSVTAQSSVNDRPHPIPLPQERETPWRTFRHSDCAVTNPALSFAKETGNDSPSPGGEGRGEGGRPTNSTSSNSPTTALQHEQEVRKACIEGRRLICGRILEILPEGLLVESGYTNLLREPLSKSWLIPGTAQASKAEYLIESKTAGSICVGKVLLSNTPKTNKAKPARYDYVNVEAYPSGEFVYRSAGTVQRTVRKFSASLVSAVQATLDAEQKP
jgi:hypothetical protein